MGQLERIRNLMAAELITKMSFDVDGRRVRFKMTERAAKVLDDLSRQLASE